MFLKSGYMSSTSSIFWTYWFFLQLPDSRPSCDGDHVNTLLIEQKYVFNMKCKACFCQFSITRFTGIKSKLTEAILRSTKIWFFSSFPSKYVNVCNFLSLVFMSQCSSDCGEGVRERTVTCTNPQGLCDPLSQPTQKEPCEDHSKCNEWKTGDWSKVRN